MFPHIYSILCVLSVWGIDPTIMQQLINYIPLSFVLSLFYSFTTIKITTTMKDNNDNDSGGRNDSENNNDSNSKKDND